MTKMQEKQDSIPDCKQYENINSDKKSVLDLINTPADIKNLSNETLKQLAEELREETIRVVSKTGGHLGASLGVVELTIALHAVFDTPKDRLIWDVSHQCYPHKILTGRRKHMHTLRQKGGLSGFTKRTESEYDPFGAGHSSTSISAGLGMAVARDLTLTRHPSKDGGNHVIAVIGDGAMSAGMAYEAMNNAGAYKSRLIVILNDNEMSIAPPVGAMSRYLTKIVSSKTYINARETGKKITGFLPSPLRHVAKRAEEGARIALSNAHGGGSLFEEMGFYYIGPVDGHNMDHLLPILRNIRDSKHEGPILIHTITQKGKGYTPAENSVNKMHGVKKFDVITGEQSKDKSGSILTYTQTFTQSLIKEASKDNKIVAITAAMPEGTGLDLFAEKFPDRMFDVGIAEQHAVTFAAGLACEGYKPFVSIYSTFLQRAYDQIIHDVAIQNLPVCFIIDRAGLVGEDGATHAGSFDTAYLGCIPNMVLMAPSDEAELVHMVATAAKYNDGSIVIRYPRGKGTGVKIPEESQILEIGKGRIVKKAKDGENTVAILSYGTRLTEALKAAKILEEKGISTTIADARFAKPLDKSLIRDLVQNHKTLIIIEEGSIGGFSSYVLEFLASENLLGTCNIKTMHLPDYFQDQDDQQKQYETAKLSAEHIAATILQD